MRPSTLAAAAFAVLALAACTADPTDPATDDTTAVAATEATTTETETAAEATATETADDIDPRLEILVGTWEADTDEVGPHGSTLAIAADGTASLASFLNQHGSYEGVIVLGTADPHRFEGTEPETGSEVVLEFAFDAEADTLTLEYEDGAVVHTRA